MSRRFRLFILWNWDSVVLPFRVVLSSCPYHALILCRLSIHFSPLSLFISFIIQLSFLSSQRLSIMHTVKEREAARKARLTTDLTCCNTSFQFSRNVTMQDFDTYKDIKECVGQNIGFVQVSQVERNKSRVKVSFLNVLRIFSSYFQ